MVRNARMFSVKPGREFKAPYFQPRSYSLPCLRVLRSWLFQARGPSTEA